MLLIMLSAFVVLLAPQTPSPNPSCSLLTPAQVTSLIGVAKATPVSSGPLGSACRLQAADEVIVVLIVNGTSLEDSTRQFESKKRIASGAALPGWTLPAYAGSQGPTVSVVGFLKGQTFIEVKVVDAPPATEGMSAKLQAIMKEIAGRK